MARVQYKNNNNEEDKIRIEQGDFIYCKANGGALSFWGIYGSSIGVVCLDGAGNVCIPIKDKIYLGENYNYWLIEKRIPCNKAKITIEELE